MPPRVVKEKWWVIALRHIATAITLVSLFWWLAIPRVQAFINDTVNDRISIIERQMVVVVDKLNHIDLQLDRIEKKQKP